MPIIKGFRSLCQDCLRVHKFDTEVAMWASMDDYHCSCGGEVCCCESCQSDIEALEKADFSSGEPIIVPNSALTNSIKGWTADGGVVE